MSLAVPSDGDFCLKEYEKKLLNSKIEIHQNKWLLWKGHGTTFHVFKGHMQLWNSISGSKH